MNATFFKLTTSSCFSSYLVKDAIYEKFCKPDRHLLKTEKQFVTVCNNIYSFLFLATGMIINENMNNAFNYSLA